MMTAFSLAVASRQSNDGKPTNGLRRDIPVSSMFDPSYDRRGFLRSLAVTAAAGVCVPLAGPAHAFTELSQSNYGRVLDSACGRNSEHARIVAETADSLGMKPSDPRLDGILQRMTCPVCGCPVLPLIAAGTQSPF